MNKRIEFEDDIVVVYEDGKVIYKGEEDYEPMKYEDWKWDSSKKHYTFENYIKVCLDI